MSLKAFHIFFIAVSVLMSLGVGAWGVQQHLVDPDGGSLALGVACFALGFVLVVYGWRVFSKLRAL